MGRDETAVEYKVILSEAARQMLIEHIQFLAHEDVDAARRIKGVLLDSIRSLSCFPARHSYISADFLPANKYRKMVIEKRYLILYQVKEQIVFIDWIMDCRQDYRWLIR
ncbi:MAG: type II toxin-antitoxin system RelE/ParE family toxin [Acidaminobacter sp.]|uniref:type II toxin-antitoxin system RelE/ParE family toxin n=1 Tax=Acidaminobacter sp. TaxID=1872102 RepID=UPI0013824AB7|nr:type II toxin-antitoxin system RelE/ParE family toxin [Acidaminobacter sp.]MZQ97094.1 type II toxin-antitoxin system RelE/ParE family toxin [Acidaminobacter sp.]